MSTWARTSTGDRFLPLVGAGAAAAIITDPDQAAAIRINDGLQMWLNDWQLDQSQGMPWQSVIGQKAPTLIGVTALLRKSILILGAPVVIAVSQIRVVYARSIRDLQYSFQAIAQSGATIQGGSHGPAGLPFTLVR